MGLRQFSAGGENHGRAAALKAIAYTTGDELKDDRNNRRYNYAANKDPERVLASALFLPSTAPDWMKRENFNSLADQQQAVWSDLAAFEEKQRFQHAGRGGKTGKPIISRSDVVILDKRLFLDENGQPRPDGLKYAQQILTDFVREEFTRKGLVASFSIHDQDTKGATGNGNFHAHIISNYRKLTAEGWGARARPYGKDAWKGWAGGKFKKVAALQQHKLEALDVMPKPDRKTRRGEVGKAWGTARSICNALIAAVENRGLISARPLPDGGANSAARTAASYDTGGTATGKYAILGKSEQTRADNAR
ncbi:MAG: MobA/MobL family protein, partial [Alphaproteobacteria bacterium]|nr:MobA/MobL family protein [Alphaproteobacteria bacterium]